MLESGQVPEFKVIQLETKTIPVCECGENRATCADCNKGYVQMAECGKVPLFKRVLAANPSDMALLTVKLAGFVKYLIYNAFCLY